MRIVVITIVVVAALAGAGVLATEVGNAQHGLAFAEKNCAQCHGVEKGDLFSPTMVAPTFSSIAETPGINERALIVWFQSSDHAAMPNLMLAQQDLDDVVAYILSLHSRK